MKQIQWYPGHMSKALREIKEKLKLVDIVIELVDSRVPFSSRNPALDEIVSNKKRLLIMTKKDMSDHLETSKWSRYFEKKFDRVIVLNLNKNLDNKIITKACKEILSEEIEKNKSKGLKEKSIRAMIVGVPNVGKSTLINKISKRKATVVADRPGVTKAQKWIKVGNDFELLDTPGVLWPKFENETIGFSLAISGAIKDQILPLDDIAVYTLNFLNKYYKEALYSRYNLCESDFDDIEIVYKKIGLKRGCIQSKNEIDYDKVSRLIIQDVRNLHFGNVSLDRVDEFV